METEQNPSALQVVKQLIPWMLEQGIWFFLVAVFAVVNAVMGVAGPFITKSLIDGALQKQGELLLTFIYLAIAIASVDSINIFLAGIAANRFQSVLMRSFRIRVAERIQKTFISYSTRFHTGDLVSRIGSDTEKIEELLQKVPGFFYNPVLFALGFSYMVSLSWKLLLAIGILMPLCTWLFDKVIKPLQEKTKKQMENMAQASELTQDALRGIIILKAFNLQKLLTAKYRTIALEMERTGLEIDRRDALETVLFLLLRFTPQLICPLYGGYLAFTGEITPGALVASISLIWLIFRPIEEMLDWRRLLRDVSPALGRLNQLLDAPLESADRMPFLQSDEAVPVALEGVCFSYDEANPVLKNLSFICERGKTLALVGQSGCGKSTVLKLITGFYGADSGEVSLFGNDLARVRLPESRKSLSLVSQETYLFPASIGENIAYGKADASMEEIIAAAEAAHAHDFIMNLPQGYETQAGEWGGRLSGGERQRIALARAILKDAPILLLDEPTSALDAHSEALVQKALERLMDRKTVLVVAHRLTTLKNADRILVLDEGSVKEEGTHADLMEKNGLYRKLYLKQEATHA